MHLKFSILVSAMLHGVFFYSWLWLHHEVTANPPAPAVTLTLWLPHVPRASQPAVTTLEKARTTKVTTVIPVPISAPIPAPPHRLTRPTLATQTSLIKPATTLNQTMAESVAASSTIQPQPANPATTTVAASTTPESINGIALPVSLNLPFAHLAQHVDQGNTGNTAKTSAASHPAELTIAETSPNPQRMSMLLRQQQMQRDAIQAELYRLTLMTVGDRLEDHAEGHCWINRQPSPDQDALQCESDALLTMMQQHGQQIVRLLDALRAMGDPVKGFQLTRHAQRILLDRL